MYFNVTLQLIFQNQFTFAFFKSDIPYCSIVA